MTKDTSSTSEKKVLFSLLDQLKNPRRVSLLLLMGLLLLGSGIGYQFYLLHTVSAEIRQSQAKLQEQMDRLDVKIQLNNPEFLETQLKECKQRIESVEKTIVETASVPSPEKELSPQGDKRADALLDVLHFQRMLVRIGEGKPFLKEFSALEERIKSLEFPEEWLQDMRLWGEGGVLPESTLRIQLGFLLEKNPLNTHGMKSEHLSLREGLKQWIGRFVRVHEMGRDTPLSPPSLPGTLEESFLEQDLSRILTVLKETRPLPAVYEKWIQKAETRMHVEAATQALYEAFLRALAE